MKKKTFTTDFFIEFLLGTAAFAIIALLFCGILLISILPINNYHHAAGYIEFKNQFKVAAQEEGVITGIFADNYSFVNSNQPLLRYHSEINDRETDALRVRLRFLTSQHLTLQRLFASGAVNKPEVERKELEIEEVKTRIRNLQKNTISSPAEGNVYYKILPQDLKGSFVEKGEIVAFIYTDESKHIRISFANTLADRFRIGGKVHFKYKDPVSFRLRRMNGRIYKTFINKENNTCDLFCEITDTTEPLKLFQPSTVVEAAVFVNTTSIFQDMFNIDPYPFFKAHIENNRLYRSLKRLTDR